MLSAIAAFKREEIKSRLERISLVAQEEDRRSTAFKESSEDTLGLYRRLSEQYETITEKDKKLLRTVTFIIRSLIALDHRVSDLLSEMEIRLDEHGKEAATMSCPFYVKMSEYMYVRMREVSTELRETMQDADTLLFNGNGPVLTKDKPET